MITSQMSQVTSGPKILEARTMREIEAEQTLFVTYKSYRYLMEDICTYKNPSKNIPVKVIFWVLFV